MPRSIYKKKIKNGKEYFFYRLKHPNLKTPKDIYATTAKELKEKIDKIKFDLDSGLKDTKESFGAFFENWLFNIHFLKLKEGSKNVYYSMYNQHIKDSFIFNVKLKDICTLDFQKYFNDLLKNKVSVSTITNIYKLMKPAIRYAYNNDYIRKDFSSAIVLPKESEQIKMEKNNKQKSFTAKQQELFVNAIKGHKMEVLFLTALYTGMRQGELLALTWDDINLDEMYIDVNKNVVKTAYVDLDGRGSYKYEVQTPKTLSSIRRVFIPSLLIEPLQSLEIKQKAHYKKLGNLYNLELNLVFCNSKGYYLDAGNVRKKFKEVAKEVGAPDVTFHSMRHAYASRLFENNVKDKTVQKLLGHSNISTTLNIYTHVQEEILRSAVNTFEGQKGAKKGQIEI